MTPKLDISNVEPSLYKTSKNVINKTNETNTIRFIIPSFLYFDRPVLMELLVYLAACLPNALQRQAQQHHQRCDLLPVRHQSNRLGF